MSIFFYLLILLLQILHRPFLMKKCASLFIILPGVYLCQLFKIWEFLKHKCFCLPNKFINQTSREFSFNRHSLKETQKNITTLFSDTLHSFMYVCSKQQRFHIVFSQFIKKMRLLFYTHISVEMIITSDILPTEKQIECIIILFHLTELEQNIYWDN